LPIWMEYLGRALRGVPQAEPEMPAGVAQVDGELFYADAEPGSGFVASIGMDGANPLAAASDAQGGVGPASMTPQQQAQPQPTVSSSEKKQILDLFESNKP
jgi:penicillin-binding protein 1A